MTPFFGMAEANHSPGPILLGTLDDMGLGLNRIVNFSLPLAGAYIYTGKTYTIKWTDTRTGEVKIEMAYEDGLAITTIENSFISKKGINEYSWYVTQTVASNNYKIKISDDAGNVAMSETFIYSSGASKPQVATPYIAPYKIYFDDSVSITFGCATSGATIRYTLNGDAPTESSQIYTSALNINETTTIKAKAFKSGYDASYVSQKTYIKGPEPVDITLVQLMAPDYNFATGSVGVWKNGQWDYTEDQRRVVSASEDIILKFDEVTSGLKFFKSNTRPTSTDNYLNYAIYPPYETTNYYRFEAYLDPRNDATIQSIYEGYSSLTVQNNKVGYSDPWFYDLTNEQLGNRNRGKDAIYHYRSLPFHTDYTAGDYQYNGVFLNKLPIGNNAYYSLQIPSGQTSNIGGTNHEFHFVRWSTNGKATISSPNNSETAVTFTEDNAIITANFKGIQLSNNNDAYTNTSQRKFVYNHGSYCYVSVYESLGKIWLEGSYDGGDTWQLLNNATALSGNGTASDPSIANAGDNLVAVVFQEDNDIKVLFVSLNYPDPTPIKESKVVHTLYTENAKPVIERQINYSNNTELFLIVWDEDYLNPMSSPGLYYRSLEKSGSTYNFINSRTKISNTDANSTNPTLAAKYNHDYLHVAWEQQLDAYSSEIRYYKVNRSSTNSLSFSYYYKPSQGNVFLVNSYPIMTVVETGGLYISWVGSSHESEDPPFKQVILRCRHTGNWWYSTFYKYGSRVNTVSLNSAEVPNQYYYGLAWVENGSTNYYKCADISGIHTLSTTGNYLHLANGLGSTSNMKAMAFTNTTVPYSFSVSESFGSGLSKQNSLNNFYGREGIVSYFSNDKENAERYYFTITDVKVDGIPIEFIELPDTVMVKNLNDVNN